MIAFTDLGMRPQDLHESSTFGGFRPLDILRPFCVSAFIKPPRKTPGLSHGDMSGAPFGA